ncbi:hypothetical protein J2T12_005129 [Paenibacillus anaericanus]|uniref:hypothetical protein n=1 Tax=Paenibacillus anaericanus TaxID=170367 RepID=UPI00278AA0C8|nr:hypothetical protein [Paenibacillus anaericanus]MDQ0091689.1 hypothetical protein [Paenibacillus anaericanus]
MDPVDKDIEEVYEEIIINFERTNSNFILVFKNVLNSLSVYDIKSATQQLFKLEETYNEDKYLLVKESINFTTKK